MAEPSATVTAAVAATAMAGGVSPAAATPPGGPHREMPPPGGIPAASTRQCLLFEVAGGRFGLWSAVVRETVRAVTVAPLPSAPPAVLGVINLRGQVVPVFSLRERFKLPAKPVEVSDHLIVALAGDRVIALHVDRALGLVDVAASDMEVAVSVTAAAEYLEGIVKFPDGLILIHDPATFLSAAESGRLDDALAVVR